MRRSSYVVTPLLTASALSLTSSAFAARSVSPLPQESQYKTPYDTFATLREGFGASFREHPFVWLAGAGWAVFVFSRGG